MWDNSLSPEDNQVKSMDWRKTRRSQKPKSDLQMETPKTKGKASSNLFKLISLPNKYSPHDVILLFPSPSQTLIERPM